MSRPRSPRCLFAVLLLSLPPATGDGTPAAPAPFVQVKGQARTTIEGGSVADGTVEVPLSGTLRVTLTLLGGPSLEVAPIKAPVPGDGWVVREPLPAAMKSVLADGQLCWQQTFIIEPLKPADVKLSLPPLHYRAAPGDEDWQTVQWDDVAVRVTTEVASADIKDLRDVPPPEAPEGPEPAWPLWPLGLALALALGLAGLVLWLRCRRPPEAAPPPPHEWAAAELDRVEALDLPAKGEVNRYHTLLSDAVRRYLEMRFQLHAPQQTTGEFLQAVRTAPQLPPAQRDQLRDFLERCDLAKFSGAAPGPEECRATAALARSVVEQTAEEADGKARAHEA
jgi:hypothetical protein